MLARDPDLTATSAFGPNVSAGLWDGPKLLFEDHREIELFHGPVDLPLEYRFLLLARKGDMILIGGERFPEFERYCQDTLGLGPIEVLTPARDLRRREQKLVARCLCDPTVMARIVAAARRLGGLSVLSYYGGGGAWNLARVIAAEAEVSVHVAAPPPKLARQLNNKLWFARRVVEVLGRESLPSTYSAWSAGALTARIAALARRFDRVAVKVPDSAGSVGNLVFDAQAIRGLALVDLRKRLLGLLGETGWHHTFPVLITVWEEDVIESPSVQVWIPRVGGADPIIEGVFSQVVEGTTAEFVGSVPSSLPHGVEEELVSEATRLALLLQALGYFGRCSFDALVIGETVENSRIHWVECNGRWGGVSIPMTLVNRLTGDWHRHPFVTVQRRGMRFPPRPFSAVLRQLSGHLYAAGEREQGTILLAPGRFVDGTGVSFAVVGEDTQAALAEANVVTKILQAEED